MNCIILREDKTVKKYYINPIIEFTWDGIIKGLSIVVNNDTYFLKGQDDLILDATAEWKNVILIESAEGYNSYEIYDMSSGITIAFPLSELNSNSKQV